MKTKRLNISKFTTDPGRAKDAAKSTVKKSVRYQKCKICTTKTHQKDEICVLCKTGITQKYDELMALLKEREEWAFLKQT
jgi:hypothetical protein